MLLDFANHIAQRVDLFTPREWVFESVNRWLMKEERPRFFLLTGEPGSGKTAIAARLCQFSTGAAQAPKELQHLRTDFLGAFHFCWARELHWINPFAFTNSLATQLANRFPEYEQALQTQRESRAVKNGRVSLNINQIVRQVINGQVIGVVINVTAGSAQDAFVVSVREPLAALHESGKLKQLVILVDALDEALLYDGKTGIVDLLSRSEELPPGISFILTSRHERSILRRFRDAGAEVNSLSSGRGLKRSREDVARHTRRLLDEQPELVNKLSPSLSPESFIKSVGDKSRGNFLYVRYLMQMLKEQPARITRHSLDKLPTGLNNLYIEFLERHVGRGWQSRYAPVIGTLAVAQEALTERQLAALTGKKQTSVRAVLSKLGQFLEQSQASSATASYTIYHESFAEFFLDEHEAEDFWCNPVEQHELIVNHYLKVWGGLRGKLAGLQDATKREADDGYGLRHMAFHLEGAGRTAELHLLLTLANDARRSVWYEAQLAEGNVAGYMADIRRAWKLAEKESESPEQRRAETALGLQIRYALVTASIRSLSGNLPPALLSALFESGIWKLPTALAYALQMPETRQQAKAIAAIAPHVPVTEITQLMAAVREIPDERSRAQALREAGRYLLRAESEQILEAIEELSNYQNRGWVLTELAPHLPQSLLSKAAEIAAQLPDGYYEYSKHHAFSALAIRRNELGFDQEACREARRIHRRHWRAMVWMKLIWNLPESRRAAAAQRLFRDAREIGDPVYLEEEMAELAALSGYLSEEEYNQALRIARELAIDTQNSEVKVKNLLRLIPHTPKSRQLDALREAEKAFEDWDPGFSREEGIVDTAQELTRSFIRFTSASETLKALSKMWPSVRLEALTTLLPSLSGSERDETLNELRQAASGSDTNIKPETRAKLTVYLSAEERKRVLRGILDEVWTISDMSERAETLTALAPSYARLGDLESSRQTAQTAQEIKDEVSRDRAYSSLATEYAEAGFLEESLKAIRLLKNNDWRLKLALKSIIPNLTAAWMPAAIEEAQRLPPSGLLSHDRDEIFKSLAWRWLQLGDPEQALATAQVLSSDRDSKLFKRVSLLPPSPSTELLAEVFGNGERSALVVAAEAAVALPDDERVREVEKIAEKLRGSYYLDYQIEALTKIAPYLTPPSKKKVLKRIRTNVLKLGPIFVLEHTGKLLPLLTADEQADAFREAINTVRSSGRLEDLVPRPIWKQFVSSLTEPLWAQAFMLVREIRNDYTHDEFLSMMLPRLAELGDVKEALLIAINLRRRDWRGPALASLAQYLDSGQLKEALDAAQVIDDTQSQVKALSNLIPYLDESQLGQALLMTLDIKESGIRSGALASLASKLRKASHRNLFGQALRGLAIRTRPELLGDLRALVTAIEHLGGITTLVSTRRAVEDVGFLWS